MSRKWVVAFIDAGNCEIAAVIVECRRPHSATKKAFKFLPAQQEEMVDKECVRITVDVAPAGL